MPHFIKMRLEETELFHADGRADRRTNVTKLKAAFRNIFKVPKINNPFLNN